MSYEVYEPQHPIAPKKRPWGRWIIGAVIGAIIVFAAASIANSDDPGPMQPIPTDRRWPPSEGQPGSAPGLPTDGILKVGTDIQPGQYKYTSVDNNIGSYFARLSCTTGEFECIIANEVVQPGSSGYLEVLPTDGWLKISDLKLEPQ